MVRLFRVFIPAGTLVLLISEAFLVSAAFIWAVYLFYSGDPTAYLLYEGGAFSIGIVVVTMIFGMYFHDRYSEIRITSRIMLAQELCMVCGAAFLVESSITYLDRNLRMPLHVMVWGSGIAAVAIFSWRLLFAALAPHMVAGDRLVLVGGSSLLHEIAKYILAHPGNGVQIIGSVQDLHAAQTEIAGIKYLGRLDALREIVRATKPTRIVVGIAERRNQVPVSDLLELRFAGNIIEEASSSFERLCGRVSLHELRPSQLIYSGDLGPRREVLYHVVFDVAVASIGLVLTAPIMLLVALAVRLTSPGPVLYRQLRVGMDGVPFTVYKFRSMRADAEADTGAVWASRNDPRVTTVGRIIRKIRLDELPQLFNVLRVYLSTVGPRPERPEFVKSLSEKIPYYRQRHAVRPGITGWAQINYKYGDTLEDTMAKLEYDLFYIKNMSLSLDLFIIFHTVKAMLMSRGSQ